MKIKIKLDEKKLGKMARPQLQKLVAAANKELEKVYDKAGSKSASRVAGEIDKLAHMHCIELDGQRSRAMVKELRIGVRPLFELP